MRPQFHIWFPFLLILVLALSGVGCDDSGESNPPPARFRQGGKGLMKPSIDARAELQQHGAGLVAGKNMDKATMEIRPPKIAETDFIESSKRRDPFRPYIEVVVPAEEMKEVIQREIKLEEYDIEQLRLIAIITNVGDPRAMVVPPDGVGFILRRGDYVGKADYVDPGSGGEKIQINWKVHRIHGSGKEEERGIYLVRDDPLTPTPNDVTRFLALHAND